MKIYDIIIAGAGFAGIYTAWRLAKAGQKVALVEAAHFIGGNLQSKPWNGFWIDNGTHNFDIRTDLGEAFYSDILREKALIFEDQPWACTIDKTWTHGFESPDFGADDPAFSALVLAELEALQAAPAAKKKPQTYVDEYKETYGCALSARLVPMMRKYTGSDPRDFAPEARGLMGMFSRLKLGNDAEMIALKSSDPFWDDRLGVTLHCGDPRFIGKNVNKRFTYPAEKGLKGLCDAAQERLSEMGVDILLSSSGSAISDVKSGIEVQAGDHILRGRKIFWSLPEVVLAKILEIDVDLMQSAIPVGTCFFAFEVPENKILGPDYLHDYSMDRLPFRYNRQGVYGQQTKPNGQSLVVTEVPCHPKDIAATATAENLQSAWEAALDIGFVAPGTHYSNAIFWSHPVSYTVPKVGWRGPYDAAQDQIKSNSRNIVGIEFGYRGRSNFMTLYETKLQHQLLGTS